MQCSSIFSLDCQIVKLYNVQGVSLIGAPLKVLRMDGKPWLGESTWTNISITIYTLLSKFWISQFMRFFLPRPAARWKILLPAHP